MKTLIISCLLTLVACQSFAQTPITLTADDFASAGSSYNVSSTNIGTELDYESSGEDFNWDFSFLVPESQYDETFLAPSETDIAYIFLWAVSNIASPLVIPVDLGVALIDEVFNFYDKGSTQYVQTGIAGTFIIDLFPTPIPISGIFDEDDVIYNFPLNYGDIDSSNSAFNITIPTLGSIQENRLRVNYTDGWGTLITPYGNFDVLRVRSELEIEDEISSPLGTFSISRKTTEYKWIGNDNGMPLLLVELQEVMGTTTVSRIIYPDSIRVIEPPLGLDVFDDRLSELSLNPNPATTFTNLSFSLHQSAGFAYSVYDVSGQFHFQSHTEMLSAGKQVIGVSLPSDLSSGTYFINLIVDGHSAGSLPIMISR